MAPPEPGGTSDERISMDGKMATGESLKHGKQPAAEPGAGRVNPPGALQPEATAPEATAQDSLVRPEKRVMPLI